MRGARVLLVDDDAQLRRVLRKVLTSERYRVTEARSGEEALEAFERGRYDLVLLDLGMPGMGGLEACRTIRASSEVALMALSVRSLEKDKVDALDAGADDYITKPFSLQELLARIRATLRRVPLEAGPEVLRAGQLEINVVAHRVIVGGHEVRLTRKEFTLLHYLAAHANTTIPHRKLLQAVWGPEYGSEVFNLRVFINQIRHKIEPEPSKPRYILTAPGVGYLLRSPESDQ